ncbi:ABC transporter ATP-binding protein/permease [Anaplasmataceae bacterium AB001_6]|nr:ABC transporter ATP-binding protein/permease [Anaplasmataceae bacterium AB001_6]
MKNIKKFSTFSSLRLFIKYVWKSNQKKHKFFIIFAFFMLLLSKIIMVFAPLAYKNIINSISSSPKHIPFLMLLIYGFSRLGTQIFSDLKDVFSSFTEQHIVKKFNIEVLTHLLNLGADFHSNRKTGEIIKKIERSSKAIERIITMSFMIMLPIVIETTIATLFLLIMYQNNIWYTAMILISVLIYITYTLKISDWRADTVKNMAKYDNQMGFQGLDLLINYENVKSFTNEEYELKKYEDFCNKYKKTAIRNKVNLSILNLGQSLIISMCLLPILFLTTYDVLKSIITVGDFVLINTILLQLFIPLNNLGFSYREIRLGLISVLEVFEILNIKPSIIDKHGAQKIEIKNGEIQFDCVTFCYEHERTILDKLSFNIIPKETTAIVGRTGSGKSTISKLLLRLFEPQEGTIKIDNKNICDVTQHSLRSQIAYVSQDITLFNSSFKENIRYGRLDATDEEVFKAAKRAKIHDFIIGTKEGYNSIVGERGIKLSGGEKQRIAIARAIIKNPKIFIFDESTSSLDTRIEKNIQENISEISEGTTTIIIAHRLSTIVAAKQIIVFENGTIIEYGNHKDLIQKQGAYYDMWQAQKNH